MQSAQTAARYHQAFAKVDRCAQRSDTRNGGLGIVGIERLTDAGYAGCDRAEQGGPDGDAAITGWAEPAGQAGWRAEDFVHEG